jgi:undecaprenyl-diphosphatase
MPAHQPRLPELETIAKPTAVVETVIAASLAAAALSLYLFAWIAEGVAHDWTKNFDLLVRQQVHQYASPALTKSMIVISFLGGNGLVIAAILAVALFLWSGWRRAALWLVTTLLGGVVLSLSLKYSFHRPRPVPFFGPTPITPSFPSGHALFSLCFYGVLAGLITGRTRSPPLRICLWCLAALMVAAIGFSRVYLGVHYPSDVIAGYLTATLWVSTMIAVDRLRRRRRQSSATGDH